MTLRSWNPIESALFARYTDLGWRERTKQKLSTLKQNGRHVADYVREFKELSCLLDAYTFSDESLRDFFRDGLDIQLRIKLLYSSLWHSKASLSQMQTFITTAYTDLLSAGLIQLKAVPVSSSYSSQKYSGSSATRTSTYSAPAAVIPVPGAPVNRSKSHSFQKSPNYEVLSPSDRLKVLNWQTRFPPGSALLPPKRLPEDTSRLLCFNCLERGHSANTCSVSRIVPQVSMVASEAERHALALVYAVVAQPESAVLFQVHHFAESSSSAEHDDTDDGCLELKE